MKTIKLTQMLACTLLFALSGIVCNPAVAANRDFLRENPSPVRAPGYEKPGGNLPVLGPEVCRGQAVSTFARLGADMEQRGEYREAISMYDNVLTGCEDEVSPVANQLVIWALSRKGSALAQQGRYEEAIAACDEALRYENDAPGASHVTRRILAWTLINKGMLLRQQGKSAEAEAVFDELIRRYQKNDFTHDAGRLAIFARLGSKFQAWSDALTGNEVGPKHAPSNYGWKSGVVGTLIVLLALYVAFRLLKVRSDMKNAAAQRSRRKKTPQEKLAAMLPSFTGTAAFLQEHPSPDAETRRLQESAVAAICAGQPEIVRRDIEQALARCQERIKENANPYEPIHPQDSTQTDGEKDTVCQLDIIHTEMLLVESVLEEAKNPATDATRSAEVREEALRICERIAGEFADDARPEIRAQAVMARLGESVILGQQGKFEEAIAVHDEMDRRYKEDAVPGVREQVATALVYKGKILAAQGKIGAAVDLYDEVDRRFGQDTSHVACFQVALALICKIEIVEKAEAIAICDEIIRRYGEDDSLAMRILIIETLARKSERLSEKAEAIAVCDEVFRRYGEDTSPDIRLCVARTFIWKSETLLDDIQERVAVYDEVVRRYGDDPSPGITEVVALAYTLRSARLKILASVPRNKQKIVRQGR
jgi:tetratricopeptide (TPR) repeat protein